MYTINRFNQVTTYASLLRVKRFRLFRWLSLMKMHMKTNLLSETNQLLSYMESILHIVIHSKL